mmetsp:Transcript_43907/g.73129  ORF Transcript_43907/g.73129 Transcript_43907/m.73129 type:complete len:338 (-) Transcript_43907:673-1686(-)
MQILPILLLLLARGGNTFYVGSQEGPLLVEMWRSFDLPKLCHHSQDERAGENIAGFGDRESCVWPDPRTDCDDKHEQCSQWAGEGECEANPRYMLIHCGKSCRSCFLRSRKFRCERNETLHHAAILEAGEINAMFTRATESIEWQHLRPKVINKDPWLISFENFMTSTEVDLFLSTLQSNWERSVDTGKLDETGNFEAIKSNARTSSSMWCTDKCWQREVTKLVAERISAITGIPVENGEYPQILRYVERQEYVTHHDYIPEHLKLPIGPRLYTFFVYLSDVEQGGETYFPHITKNGVKVKPKKGKAVLWPSVLDSNAFQIDRRTRHAALPVIKVME